LKLDAESLAETVGAQQRTFNRRPRAISAPPAPTHQHSETDSCQHCARQFPVVADRDETGRLVADLDHAYGNGSYPTAATAAFAPRAGIAHASSARPGAIPIGYFRNWYDGLSVSRYRFAVKGFDAGLT
jgi:hypothetical protein